MYSKTVMYLGGSNPGPSRSDARYWGRARGALDRLLLALGFVSLVLLVPALWIWLLYSGRFGGGLVYAGGLGLSTLAAGIGLAMIRMLDGRR
jgi:hypothetical protein